MLERFKDEARRVVVFAQGEANGLKHAHIGTEHLLLGLLRQETGAAARALESLEVTLERVRAEVTQTVGMGTQTSSASLSFTPRAKALFARASHEARERGDDQIGTEHLLLALAEEDESIAARVLRHLGADSMRVRHEVLEALGPVQAAHADQEPVILDPAMFNCFGDRARQILILAQDEARLLKHNQIGTEHILLGLLRAEDGVAVRTLESLGIALETGRAQVLQIVGPGEAATPWQLPFTSRTKKMLELAWHKARALHHDKVGPEHILLGLVCETEGVAASILRERDADPETVRAEDLGLEPRPPGKP